LYISTDASVPRVASLQNAAYAPALAAAAEGAKRQPRLSDQLRDHPDRERTTPVFLNWGSH
jgi:hypothetical protein